MPKKHMQGFTPIPFKLAGKILLPVGLVMVAAGAFDYFLNWDLIPSVVGFIGLGLLILGLYLVYVVPKES